MEFPIFLYGIVFATAVLTTRQLLRHQKLQKFARLNECQDPSFEKLKDPFGIFKILEVVRRFRQRTVLVYTQSLFEKYGTTYISQFLGLKIIFTCNPTNIRHVLSEGFQDFDAAYHRVDLFENLSKYGVLTLDGSDWKHSRENLRRQFSRYRSMIDLEMQEHHVQNFLRRVPSDGMTVDLQELFSNLTLDIMSELTLGESVESLSIDQPFEKKRFSEALKYTTKKIAQKGFLGPLHWLGSGKRFRTACGVVQDYIQEYVCQEFEQQPDQGNKGSGKGLQKRFLLQGLAADEKRTLVLRDQLSNILVAGFDSQSSFLSSAFWLLARDSRVCDKLRIEIEQVVGRECPTFEQIGSLKYMRYTLNEVLRLYPPVPFDERRAKRTTTLPCGGGFDGLSKIVVERGQSVVFSSYSTHRFTQVYGEDAEEFRPERWETLKRDEHHYLPFHCGPRVCPGQQYALTYAAYTIVRLLQTFDKIESRDPRVWTERICMTLENDNGVLVGLYRS